RHGQPALQTRRLKAAVGEGLTGDVKKTLLFTPLVCQTTPFNSRMPMGILYVNLGLPGKGKKERIFPPKLELVKVGKGGGILPEILTVSQVTLYIKRLLETDEALQQVWVCGEISNFTLHSSGHMYFTLKDEKARLRAV